MLNCQQATDIIQNLSSSNGNYFGNEMRWADEDKTWKRLSLFF